MTTERWFGLILLAALLMQLAGLAFVVSVDPYIRKEHIRSMQVIVVLLLSLLFRDALAVFMDERGGMPFARTVTAVYGYAVRPVILVLFCRIVGPDTRIREAWILAAVNALVFLTALWSGLCFTIDEAHIFRRGPLGYTCHIVSAVLLMQLCFLTFGKYRRQFRAEAWIPTVNVIAIIASVAADMVYEVPGSFLTAAMVSSSLFYYIWLHLNFVREHERELKAEQRIRIMMSQIGPHFLFNTISTIRVLCRRDPEKAAVVTEKFGIYLRQNLDSLGCPGLIPFRKELEHTRLYTDIEMVRFDNIRVEYDIEDSDFLVPPLTLQPMVENAIRHGVRIREEGIVRVASRRNGAFHEITVRDNGAGFDTGKFVKKENSGKADEAHIGIRNVRARLRSMCGASMLIESVIGQGTTVSIRIPDAGPAEREGCGEQEAG